MIFRYVHRLGEMYIPIIFIYLAIFTAIHVKYILIYICPKKYQCYKSLHIIQINMQYYYTPISTVFFTNKHNWQHSGLRLDAICNTKQHTYFIIDWNWHWSIFDITYIDIWRLIYRLGIDSWYINIILLRNHYTTIEYLNMCIDINIMTKLIYGLSQYQWISDTL